MLVHDEFTPTDNLTEQWRQYQKLNFGDDGDNQSMLFCAKPNFPASAMQDSFRFAFNGPTTVRKDGFGYCTWEEYPAKTARAFSNVVDFYSSVHVEPDEWYMWPSLYNYGAFKAVQAQAGRGSHFVVPNRTKDDFLYMSGKFIDQQPVWNGAGRFKENNLVEVKGNQWIINSVGQYLVETFTTIEVGGQDFSTKIEAEFTTDGGVVNRANLGKPSWTVRLIDADGRFVEDLSEEDREESQRPWKPQVSQLHFFEYFDVVEPPVKISFKCEPGTLTGDWVVATQRNDRSGFYLRSFPLTLRPVWWYGYWGSFGWFEYGVADGGINWSVRRVRPE